MLKIALVNLPFAAYHLPSIGLTQLQAVLEEQYGEQVSVRTFYANHAFANYMGLDLYEAIGSPDKYLGASFPEWFFRQANGQGRTVEECQASLSEAIALILEDRREDGLRGVPPEAIRATTVRRARSLRIFMTNS